MRDLFNNKAAFSTHKQLFNGLSAMWKIILQGFDNTARFPTFQHHLALRCGMKKELPRTAKEKYIVQCGPLFLSTLLDTRKARRSKIFAMMSIL